ncbi:MAG TPA: hypothetical protein VFM58_07435 [Solirubrobacteraceae bacterium]|nr:hypothetical protein [Solirubrobacteraceae bacterium]
MAAVSHPSEPDRRSRLQTIARIEGHAADALVYWLGVFGIYLTFGFLWYYAAKEKLFDQDGTMPVGLKKAFDGSFIDSVPGLDTAWLLLGLLDAAAFLLIAASLITGELLPNRRKPLLLAGLGVSIFTFAVMAFANNMIGNYETVASLFSYFTGTVIVIGLILLMPPYRGREWLSRITRS